MLEIKTDGQKILCRAGTLEHMPDRIGRTVLGVGCCAVGFRHLLGGRGGSKDSLADENHGEERYLECE